MNKLLQKWYCNKLFCITKHSLVLCFVFFANLTHAQVNLVQDGSFEDTIEIKFGQHVPQKCIKNWSTIDSLWPSTGYTAYLHYVFPDGDERLPFTGTAYINSRTGYAVVQLTTFWRYGWNRSLIRNRLKHNLIAGKSYCGKCYNQPSNAATLVTNGFSMYFDNGQLDTNIVLDSSCKYYFVHPQIILNQINSDTGKWTLLSGTFIANGTETMLTLGNFLSDSAILTFNQFPNSINQCECAETFVDDVSLIPVDIANWLHDTSCAIGDSVYIGLPTYEVPDAIWYTANGTLIDTASGIWVHPTQPITKYVQVIDVCDTLRFDTLTVKLFPLNIKSLSSNITMQIYPNPAKETFTVQKVYGSKVQLINMYGQVVQQQMVLNNSATFNVGALARGVYYVKGEGQVGKVVVD
jgi:Secretion system C-terminal sorting domain